MSHFVTFSKTWKAPTKLVSSLIFYLVDMNSYQRENIKVQKTHTTSIFTQTTLILTWKHRLHLFSFRHTDYFHSPPDTLTTPLLTQTHRLLPFSLRHTDSSHSHSDTQTHLFSQTHTDNTYFHSNKQNTSILTQTTLVLSKEAKDYSHKLFQLSLRHPNNTHSH